jgi:hypothetical protein
MTRISRMSCCAYHVLQLLPQLRDLCDFDFDGLSLFRLLISKTVSLALQGIELSIG